MRKYTCVVCGYVYDEAAGIPDKGIAPGTQWDSLPGNFRCPLCKAQKSLFKQLDEPPEPEQAADAEMSPGALYAICDRLAQACDGQGLPDEREAFEQIAAYFKAEAGDTPNTLAGEANQREPGDMLPQSDQTRALLDALLDYSVPDFPMDAVIFLIQNL